MTFSTIPGLDAVKQILVDAVKSSHIAHAQLFVGTEGALNLPLAPGGIKQSFVSTSLGVSVKF